MKSRVMYIEFKGNGIDGPARIGRVFSSKSGKTLHYKDKKFQSLKGGYKANYFDVETGDEYWISGCKKDGSDRLYSGTMEIDIDVREEYWVDIRKMPECKDQGTIRSSGKCYR